MATQPPSRPAATPSKRTHLPLLARLDVDIAGGVIGLPREGHEGLLSWLTMQEIAHGQTPQISRVAQLIEVGDWDRARQAALATTCMLVTKAACRAKTEEEQNDILSLLRQRQVAKVTEE